jgi:hypothetical protein
VGFGADGWFEDGLAEAGAAGTGRLAMTKSHHRWPLWWLARGSGQAGAGEVTQNTDDDAHDGVGAAPQLVGHRPSSFLGLGFDASRG